MRPPYHLHHTYERLLGTEVELQILADTRTHAHAAERSALDELQRLTRVLNRFDPDSELSRWQAHPGERVPLSANLRDVLALADTWRQASGGAFHPGADALGAVWQRAAQDDVPPPADELARLVLALRANPWTLHGDGTGTLHARTPIGLNALAKGYVVDRMAERAAAHPGVRTTLVNAGGDLRLIGGRGVQTRVADPHTHRDDAPPVAQVIVRDGALATSGRAHRGYRVRGQWHSHVIDPRTGQPVHHLHGVTVTAPTCAQADALATVLSVLPPDEGFALLDGQPGCAALLITDGGVQHPSPGWAGHATL